VNPAYLLALGASVFYGTADFLGGFATRRAPANTVTFIAAAAGVPGLFLLAPLMPGTPTREALLWAMAAGASGGLGVALLYRAFARGPVSVAAPVISLVALLVPVGFGLLSGERPREIGVAGIALALAAFPLLSRPASDAHSHASTRAPGARGVVTLAILAGVLVGGFLVLVRRIGPHAGFVPLVVARLTTVALFAVLIAVRREPFRVPRAVRGPTLGSGVLDSLANVTYYLAVHGGALAILGTIVSLAPAVTVLLARLVLHERWSVAQRAGLVLSAAAIVCVSLG